MARVTRNVLRPGAFYFALLSFAGWAAWEHLSGVALEASAAEAIPAGTVSDTPNKVRGGPNLDPAKIEGQSLCVDCHRAEVAHWMGNWRESEHGWIGFTRLLGERAEELADDLGIDASDVTKNSVCIECHATPNLDYHGQMKPILGVACEACHGPSGGNQGWLNVHAAYGPRGTRRVDETAEHYVQRKQNSEEAGQLQSDDVYLLVRRCFNCHIVGDEELITKTDHVSEDRNWSDVVSMITDPKIRHNFHMDQTTNAEVSTLWSDPHRHPQRGADMERSIERRKKMYFVAATLARGEVVLRLLAKVNDPYGDYAGDVSSLFDVGDVEDVLESVELSDEDAEKAAELIETLEDLELEDTAGDTDEDEKLSGEERAALNSVADRIAELGKQLVGGDGEKLDEVELP